jgi:hypothetical protein
LRTLCRRAARLHPHLNQAHEARGINAPLMQGTRLAHVVGGRQLTVQSEAPKLLPVLDVQPQTGCL